MQLRFLKSRIAEPREEIAAYTVPGRAHSAWAIYSDRNGRRELEPVERKAKTLIRFLRGGAFHGLRVLTDMISAV